MMKKDMDDVEFAMLRGETLQQVRALERQISSEMGKEIILLAYQGRDETAADEENPEGQR